MNELAWKKETLYLKHDSLWVEKKLLVSLLERHQFKWFMLAINAIYFFLQQWTMARWKHWTEFVDGKKCCSLFQCRYIWRCLNSDDQKEL